MSPSESPHPWHVVLAAKSLDRAKSRLAPFGNQGRRALATAMAETSSPPSSIRNWRVGDTTLGRAAVANANVLIDYHEVERLECSMIIGVVREASPGETRVAATPATVAQLLKLGYEVVVESCAGVASSFPDEAYVEAGATIGDAAQVLDADIVFGVNAPSAVQLDKLREGATVVSIMSPGLNPELVEDLARRPITALAMDAVPRISRAQSLDVLSSMANIAGYRAVVEAAHVFGRFFTGQVTAAGKVPPAKVLVAGAGVAGLAAIGAAGSLGAIVYATDPRPEVADQVKSLGGEYLSVEAADVEVSATGYAKEMSDDYNTRAAALYAEQANDVDIIITTALIPGRPAPRLITAEMVASMKSGSVIVDMAASNGGNVEGAGIAALWHQPGQPDEADDAGEGRAACARLGRRRTALHYCHPQRRVGLAAPAGAGVRGAGRCHPRRTGCGGVAGDEADLA